MKGRVSILCALVAMTATSASSAKGKGAPPAAPVCAASCDAACVHCCTSWAIQAVCDDGSVVAVEGSMTDGRAAERVATDLDHRAGQCSGNGEACARLKLACPSSKDAHWRAACNGALPDNAATPGAAEIERAHTLGKALALCAADAAPALATFAARPDLKSAAQKRAQRLMQDLPADHDKLGAVASDPMAAGPATRKLFEHAAADVTDARKLVEDPKSIDPHYQDKAGEAEHEAKLAAEKAEREQKRAQEKAEREQKRAQEKAEREQKRAEEKAEHEAKLAAQKAAHEQASAEKAAAAAAAAEAAAQARQAADAAALDDAKKSRVAAGVTVASADRKAYGAIILADKWLAQPNLKSTDRKAIKSARDHLASTRKKLAGLHTELSADPASDAQKAKSTALKQRVRAKDLSRTVDEQYDELGTALRKAAGQ